MATPKKKHLIELMIEADVKWPDGAEYAAQDKYDNTVYFFNSKPKVYTGETHYCAPLGTVGNPRLLSSLCRNWHQTIVTREQYVEAVDDASKVVINNNTDCAVEWHNPPSIEQLTADYHAKAAESDRLQAVADDALKAADDALLALKRAGELLGLVISIDTKQKQVEQSSQPDITDWRDLRVGDVIVIDYIDVDPVRKKALEGAESVIVRDGAEYPICATNKNYPHGQSWFMGAPAEKRWRFIRRP